jgi:hypothetical protein
MTSQTEPCAVEIELLRDLNGEKTTISGWGSWMTPAIEWLHGHKFVDRIIDSGGVNYRISEKGKAFLATQEPPR